MPIDPNEVKWDAGPPPDEVKWDAKPAHPAAGPMSWGEVGKQALSNLPVSGAAYVKDMAHAVAHPIDTAKTVGNVAGGEWQKLMDVTGGSAHQTPESRLDETAATGLNAALKQRYGGVENIKHTLATDPVGALSDIAGVAAGGGGALSKVPGVVGRAGKLAAEAGKLADPGTLAAKGAAAVAKGTGKVIPHVIGMTTGVGPTPLKEAFQAGKEGGAKAQALLSNMRGTAPAEEVVDTARAALDEMRKERGAEYRAGIAEAFGKTGAQTAADPTILKFNEIEKAIDKVESVGKYEGETIYKSASSVWDQVREAVDTWKASDPERFHTVEGLDALKKRIGDIRDSTGYGTPSRKIANDVYSAVRAEIVKQAPQYAKVMKDYEEASDLLGELQHSLSLGEKAHADTTLRKLQSIMRNNVHSNYGRRTELGRTLERAGADTLFPSLAGQSLSSPAPRGLAPIGAAAEAGAALMSGHPEALLLAPMASPRRMGEAAYKAGQVAKPASEIARALEGLGFAPMVARQLAVQAGRVKQ